MGELHITGAAGEVARMIRPYLRERFGALTLSDITRPDDMADAETFREADLTDSDAMRAAIAGADRVIHLSGQPVEADWATIDALNIEGHWNALEAARSAGASRFVFASSNHAVGFYPRHRRIGVDHAVRPDSLYGVSKAFGEAMCRLYADKYGMRTFSIRIGKCAARPTDERRLSIWIHPADLAQLCAIGLTHESVHNQIVFGVSSNIRGWWDNAAAYDLGYRPDHLAEDHAAGALSAEPDDEVARRFMGGPFASDGFEGDRDRALWS